MNNSLSLFSFCSPWAQHNLCIKWQLEVVFHFYNFQNISCSQVFDFVPMFVFAPPCATQQPCLLQAKARQSLGGEFQVVANPSFLICKKSTERTESTREELMNNENRMFYKPVTLFIAVRLKHKAGLSVMLWKRFLHCIWKIWLTLRWEIHSKSINA